MKSKFEKESCNIQVNVVKRIVFHSVLKVYKQYENFYKRFKNKTFDSFHVSPNM